MNTYLNGTDVTLTLPLEDAQGNVLDVTAVEYRVTDGNDVEKIPKAAASFTSGDTEVVIVIDDAANTMAVLGDLNDREQVIEFREARIVTLYMQTAEGLVTASHVYGLEREQSMIVGVNTFQTYGQAMINSAEIADKLGWDEADEATRKSALIEARQRISRMSFKIDNADMSKLSYGSSLGSFGSGMENYFTPSLDRMSKADYDGLPAKFRKALAMAQIAEADYILNGDELEEMKAAGVDTVKVGESLHAFRPGKALEYPICRKALVHVQRYVRLSVNVARG